MAVLYRYCGVGMVCGSMEEQIYGHIAVPLSIKEKNSKSVLWSRLPTRLPREARDNQVFANKASAALSVVPISGPGSQIVVIVVVG